VLKENILGVIVLIRKPLPSAIDVLKLKSILWVGPKAKDSIEEPFKYVTWLGSVRVGLHVEVRGTTTALGYVSATSL
jgi:hypothetical protein